MLPSKSPSRYSTDFFMYGINIKKEVNFNEIFLIKKIVFIYEKWHVRMRKLS